MAGDNSERVLIVETACAGHHLVYARLLADAALGRGASVAIAATARVVSDARFALHLGDIQGNIQVVEIEEGVSLGHLQELGRRLDAYVVLVPDALPFGSNLLLGKRSRIPELRLLVMNDPRWKLEGTLRPQPTQWAKLLFLLLVSRRRGQVIYWLRPPGYQSNDENYVCDPVIIESTTESVKLAASELRKRLEVADDVFWFGLVGGIGDWKNPSMVIEACIAAQARTGRRLGLLVIGQWRASLSLADAQSALRDGGVAMVTDERNLTNAEINAAIAALDCLVLAYSTHAPNSTAGKAAALGVRVVAAGTPSFRRFAHEITGTNGLHLDHESLVQGMLDSIARESPTPRRGYGADEFAGPFLAKRTHEAPATMRMPSGLARRIVFDVAEGLKSRTSQLGRRRN